MRTVLTAGLLALGAPANAGQTLICVLEPNNVSVMVDIANNAFRFEDSSWEYVRIVQTENGVGMEYARSGDIFMLAYFFENGEAVWVFRTTDRGEKNGPARCSLSP